jgi:hypothetical protein
VNTTVAGRIVDSGVSIYVKANIRAPLIEPGKDLLGNVLTPATRCCPAINYDAADWYEIVFAVEFDKLECTSCAC